MNPSHGAVGNGEHARLRFVRQADGGDHGRRMLSPRGQEAERRGNRAVVAARLAQIAPDRIALSDRPPTAPERKAFS